MSSAADGNPLLEGLRLRRSPDSCAIVIFGATGDLTRRKIFPALYIRFRSRRDHTFAEKLLSALRAQFGGHVEPPR